MSKSIIQKDKNGCFFCGSNHWLEEHHVYGAANRKKSENYGLKVWLCHYCHNEPPYGVHFNADQNQWLKANTQQKAMAHYGWDVDTFRNIFGKSYL